MVLSMTHSSSLHAFQYHLRFLAYVYRLETQYANGTKSWPHYTVGGVSCYCDIINSKDDGSSG